MHHHFASNLLIDTLYSHGFCSSYSTVHKYERSAAVDQGTEIPGWIPAGAKDDIIAAGERALVCLYNGRSGESLNFLRCTRFCQKVATGNACVQPECLPPTSAAASFHSTRVYHQVQQW